MMSKSTALFALLLLVPLSMAKPQKRQASGDMTDELRQLVVDEHNSYRQKLVNGEVQSADGLLTTSLNMNDLVYDQDLENQAQSWADQCPGMEHTPDAEYGQNLYGSSGPEDPSDSIRSAAQMWWDEVQQYSSPDNVLTMDVFNEGVGHFTQMAWAQATKVGCAVKDCDGAFLVCNYDVGNMLGETIF